MAMNTHAPKQTNWLVWAGAAAAVIVVVVAFGYGVDWFGAEASDAVAPVTEQVAPASD
ncbi:hypothetical protein FIU97_03600 [Roseivivax sp. THAF40]|uniref:hypothetical protein n=1 Tax=unclassified Roseivivax TaxID=2639302 RepID=UPI0012AA0DDB|nr:MULTISPECIES: hypothetical protein [unclassified Roseivivax]QFS81853.1 hypothetical protein FIV09_03340 [Roseivivax sp. THAF197b]QFT45653.1 hypothetical protein FIU97_03600 [Roseivivax sp. THAF40]